jgi:hypothetical protein
MMLKGMLGMLHNLLYKALLLVPVYEIWLQIASCRDVATMLIIYLCRKFLPDTDRVQHHLVALAVGIA